jgi:ferredoxin-NADP reductase
VDSYTPVAPERFIEQVRNTARDQPDALFYLCGSNRLVTSVRRELASAAISRRSMRVENFR